MALTKIDDRGLKTPIDLLDNEKIRLGTGNDLELYHDGSNNYIKDSGTGNLLIDQSTANVLYLRSDDLRLSSYTGTETYIDCNLNGNVELYYDNSKKLETTSSGVTVTGQLHVDGGYINLDDNYSYGMGTNNRAQLYHNGSNLYLFNTVGTTYIQPKAGENGIELIPDGSVKLYSNNLLRFETHSDGCSLRSTSYSNSAAHWVEGGLKPWANNTYDLGDASYRWRNIHCNDGILFQGNNTTATTLDDYEEGTYTPADASGNGITYTSDSTARYVKIGMLVYVQYDFTLTNCNNLTTQSAVFTLPFSLGHSYGSGVIGWTSLNKPCQVHIASGGAYLMDNDSDTSIYLKNNQLNNIRFIGNMHYVTTT